MNKDVEQKHDNAADTYVPRKHVTFDGSMTLLSAIWFPILLLSEVGL